MPLIAYDPAALARRRRACRCHSPAEARAVAERVAREVAGRRGRESEHDRVLAREGGEPVILAASDGAQCRPSLTLEHDPERFAACTALADEIGPLDDPKKAFRLISEAIGNEVNEVFGLVPLDLHMRLISVILTGRGEQDAVMAPLKPTLRLALIEGAHAVLLMHVHPSGVEAQPSDADKETTDAFAEAFEAVDIHLLDHLIVSGNRKSYFSFLEAGLLPAPTPEPD